MQETTAPLASSFHRAAPARTASSGREEDAEEEERRAPRRRPCGPAHEERARDVGVHRVAARARLRERLDARRERARRGERVLDVVLQRPVVEVFAVVEPRVVAPSSADEREVDPRQSRGLEHGQVRVVRHAAVDLDGDRARRRMGERGARVDEFAVAERRLEHPARAARAARFDVDDDGDVPAERARLDERLRAEEAHLLAVVEEEAHGPRERFVGRAERARSLEQRRDARSVVPRARSGGDRVVVRAEEHGSRGFDARGARELGAARFRALAACIGHDDVSDAREDVAAQDGVLLDDRREAEPFELGDEALAHAGVLRAPDRMGDARVEHALVERARARRGRKGRGRVRAERARRPREHAQERVGREKQRERGDERRERPGERSGARLGLHARRSLRRAAHAIESARDSSRPTTRRAANSRRSGRCRGALATPCGGAGLRGARGSTPRSRAGGPSAARSPVRGR